MKVKELLELDQSTLPHIRAKRGERGRYLGDSELETKSITMSLFLRLLEWAKEDAKDDVALHVAAENLFSMEAGSLGIDSYEKIIPE